MPKNIASLFSGCGGLDLGFSGGFVFRNTVCERLDTNIVLQTISTEMHGLVIIIMSS